jgi:ice-binding like protein
MLRSISVLPTARLAIVLPFTLLAAACGGADLPTEVEGASGGGGAGGNAATPGNSAGPGNSATPGNAPTPGNSAAPGNGAPSGEATPTGAGSSDPELALGPAAVPLGDAGGYAILAQSAITNVPPSVITGDLGLSPAAASYITGFALTRAGTMWTSPEISGGAFAADNDPTTPADLTSAVADMGTAYDDAAGRPDPASLNLADGAIGGLTLAPGLYRWTSTVTIPTDVTLSGGALDTWIFQIAGDLQLGAAQQMTLEGGARPENIIWQVAGEVNLGSTSHAEGIVLSKTAIHLSTGASINGRLLAQTAVTLQSNTVTEPSR